MYSVKYRTITYIYGFGPAPYRPGILLNLSHACRLQSATRGMSKPAKQQHDSTHPGELHSSHTTVCADLVLGICKPTQFFIRKTVSCIAGLCIKSCLQHESTESRKGACIPLQRDMFTSIHWLTARRNNCKYFQTSDMSMCF